MYHPKNVVSNLVLIISLLMLPGLAQETVVDSSCMPSSLSSPFDIYANTTSDIQQISIWYDYGRDPYQKGKYAGKTARYQTAIPYFWKVVLNDQTGTFKATYGKLADCYLQLNKADSALIVVYRGLKKYPDYGSLHFIAGQIFNTRNQPECAIPHYLALANSSGADSVTLKNYWSTLSKLYMQIGDERSVEAQEKVVALAPTDAEAAAQLARLMDEFGMDSMEATESAFRTDVTNVANARRFGLAAYNAGQYDKSIEAYSAVLKVHPDNLEAQNYIARSYEGLGQNQKAIGIYQNILKSRPDQLSVMCALASAHSRVGQFTAARRYVRRALQKDSNYGLAHMVMGEIYENAVANCVKGRTNSNYTLDDKLVFEKAREAYQRAARDPNIAASAKNRYAQLAPFVRTIEDKHMQSRTKIEDPCYNWIN